MSSSLIRSENVWQTFAIENRSVDISHNQSLVYQLLLKISAYWWTNCRLQLRICYPLRHYYYIMWCQCGMGIWCVLKCLCAEQTTVMQTFYWRSPFSYSMQLSVSNMTSVCGLEVEMNFKVDLSNLTTELKILWCLFSLHRSIIGCNSSVWSE